MHTGNEGNAMTEAINIYCDESCHLEHDEGTAMVLGAIWCPAVQVRNLHIRLRDLKRKHGLSDAFEIKWTKVSPAKLEFYQAAMDLFFQSEDLHFRALVVPDKSILKHEVRGQTHDEWYYKMYFHMLETLIQPGGKHHIFLDHKDTQGAARAQKLHQVLCNNFYDFDRAVIASLAIVDSREVGLVQLADLLIGAVCHANRTATGSPAKRALVEHMRRRSGYSLTRTTLLKEAKTNILIWRPKETEA
jgi:hypothetical protein